MCPGCAPAAWRKGWRNVARPFKDRRLAREAGRKGGYARAAKLRAARGGAPEPFAGSVVDLMDAAGLTGETWSAWRTFWKAASGLPLEVGELEMFRRHTGRQEPPPGAVRELWVVAGASSTFSSRLRRRA